MVAVARTGDSNVACQESLVLSMRFERHGISRQQLDIPFDVSELDSDLML